MKNKSVFKKGDRVFDIHYGWGVIIEVVQDFIYSIIVEFDGDNFESYTYDGRINKGISAFLSFTEYKLEGFSQERPEELPKKGQICWVRDSEFQSWMIAHFMERINDLYQVTLNWDKKTASYWKYITTKNPYENV
jgi:hypothetical protein